MDYRALVGLSMVLAVLMVGARFAVMPVVRDLLENWREQGRKRDTARLEYLEGRVTELELEVERVRTGQEFDRRLEEGEPHAQGRPGAPRDVGPDVEAARDGGPGLSRG
jgi:hypothetical protein